MIGRFVERGRSLRSDRHFAAGNGLSESGLAPAYPDPRRLTAGIVFFLVLGCLLRIVRYAQNLPLWSDECFLAVNFIRRGYAELLQPLDNGQIAPLLFLWAQRLVIDLVGFSEMRPAALCSAVRPGQRLLVLAVRWRRARVSQLTGIAGGGHLRGERASDPPCRRGQALCIRPLDGSCLACSRREVAARPGGERLALGASRR